MKPFTCPVCVGTGMVSAGFYSNGLSTSTSPESCRSCAGTGIVWSGISDPVLEKVWDNPADDIFDGPRIVNPSQFTA